jgi:hypothetical protein
MRENTVLMHTDITMRRRTLMRSTITMSRGTRRRTPLSIRYAE